MTPSHGRGNAPFQAADDRRFNPDEPGKTQLKFYEPGIAYLQGWCGKSEKEREELELTSQLTLSDAELARVDKALLAQEKRAYSRRREVFGPTAHVKEACIDPRLPELLCQLRLTELHRS